MSYEWMNLVGPADYEPDYDAAIAEWDSIDAMMADVGSYDDWFVDHFGPAGASTQ